MRIDVYLFTIMTLAQRARFETGIKTRGIRSSVHYHDRYNDCKDQILCMISETDCTPTPLHMSLDQLAERICEELADATDRLDSVIVKIGGSRVSFEPKRPDRRLAG